MYEYPKLLECHDIHLELINYKYEDMNALIKKEDDPVVGDAKVDAYADAVGMNDRNREAMKVLVNDGMSAFYKHILTGDQGETLDYAEMRARYG
jgi:hypothetical protein